MGFRIVQTKNDGQLELSRFRAHNIVHMRNFMASLGGKGAGLFSSKGDEEGLVNLNRGNQNTDEISNEVFIQQDSGKMATADLVFALPANGNIHTYTDAILQMPVDFYCNIYTGITLRSDFIKERKFPGYPFPLYDADSPLSKYQRRPQNDTFRSPQVRNPTYIFSMGYGADVGLPNGMQEVFDPCVNRSIVLDHNNSRLIFEDFRPPPYCCPPPPKASFYNLGDVIQRSMPSEVYDQRPSVVKEAAERARFKPVGSTLYARGRKGRSGADGLPGALGLDGKHGKNAFRRRKHGTNGHIGGDGGRGGNGERGMNGIRGGDVILNLNGRPEELQVTGSINVELNLGQSENILLVDCHGGDGGQGGAGGQGGEGGRGGDGGEGANATRGGNGGDGGDGGDGGNGGNAGDGGNAGSGGNCVIQASDPRFLILVEVDCMPGEPGDGAQCGGAGSGGSGGIGGRGGLGDGFAPNGAIGRHGYSGRSGADGRQSRKGVRGKCGGILWTVWSPIDSSIIHQSDKRYDAKVDGLNVIPACNGGVFEPNERITVSGVLVHNTGGLDLPFGAILFMPTTDTVKFEPSRYKIPEGAIKAGKKCIIPFEFHGRINDLPPPEKPGRQTITAEFYSRIELLGRAFEKSFYKQKLIVQYPVQLNRLICPENMRRGEINTISIEVSNISNLPYGTCFGSCGKAVLHLHFDARIILLGVAANTGTIIPYAVTYNPTLRDSMYVELFELPPRYTITVSIKIQMEDRAEHFDRCFWQADLHLREKLVEYNFQHVRVVPTYSPQQVPADVLLVTSEAISRKEFVFWQHILELLGVSVDFWDTTRYCGMSIDSRTNARHRDSWQGRYTGKMILYPHCNLKFLNGHDIAIHFHGENCSKNNLEELGSSLIAFMPQSSLPQHDKHAMLKHLAAAGTSIQIPENSYRGKHITRPSLSDFPPVYAKWERNFIKKLEKSNPAQVPVLFARNVDIKSVGFWHYSYGSIDAREIPILKSSKFLEIDGVGGNMVAMSLDDAHLSTSSTDIPLASKYGQVFLAILYGIPLSAKLNLIKSEPELEHPPSDLKFYLPNRTNISREELAMVTLAWEVADEVFSGGAHRMQEVYQDISINPDAYMENGRIILRGLKLIKKELNKRRSKVKHSKVSQAYNEINDMVEKTQKVLVRAGVENSNLEKMISLKFLLDCDRVHRCHQHYVKDNVWNLIN